MKSILDRTFRYTPSEKTDVKKTFARIRRMEREKQAAQAKADAEAMSKVQSINQNKINNDHPKIATLKHV